MKYVKLPVVIDAIQFNGDNKDEVLQFVGSNSYEDNGDILIYTLGGDLRVCVGDYVIRGVNGECYPCKPDLFQKTYTEYKGATIDNSTTWAKTSERTPNDRDWYLGIFQEVDTGWINPIPFVCFYLGKASKYTTQDYWVIKDTDDNSVEYHKLLRCVAWTNLPIPYKEQK